MERAFASVVTSFAFMWMGWSVAHMVRESYKPKPPTEVQMRIHEGIMDGYDRQEFDPLGLIAEQLEAKREIK